jgi:hypothetical protein
MHQGNRARRGSSTNVLARGRVKLDGLAPALPGGPVLKFDAAASSGHISFGHLQVRNGRVARRRLWRRRTAE